MLLVGIQDYSLSSVSPLIDINDTETKFKQKKSCRVPVCLDVRLWQRNLTLKIISLLDVWKLFDNCDNQGHKLIKKTA